jgi:hypothetical protein
MRLAASGAPVAVKRRAVELVNKIKLLPVCTRIYTSINLVVFVMNIYIYIYIYSYNLKK